MSRRINPILNTDSYKASHWLQYPPGITGVFSYIEARENDNYKDVVFFGLQAYLKEYLQRRIFLADILEAEEIFKKHGEPFNKYGWLDLLTDLELKGAFPLEVKAVPEGTVVPTGNVLVTVENTNPRFWWLPSYIETGMLRSVWFPTTVATISWHIKSLIRKYMIATAGHSDGLEFKLHDFGARGTSSLESAMLGGLAHLVNFKGTDTVSALVGARLYYGADMPAYSIPAAEHSTITAWGEDREVDAYRNMITQFGAPGKPVAVVSDSYNIYNAVDKLWGETLRQEVVDSGMLLIVRPDSGNPVEVVLRVARLLDMRFGSEPNRNKYKVLKNVRIIQGDGINPKSIEQILAELMKYGYSAENIAFGMGGALLQKLDRDTLSFAMKTSAVKDIDGWIEVSKDPITSSAKKSKAGRLQLYRDGSKYITLPESRLAPSPLLETVYKDGEITKEYSLEEIRERANQD